MSAQASPAGSSLSYEGASVPAKKHKQRGITAARAENVANESVAVNTWLLAGLLGVLGVVFVTFRYPLFSYL